MQHPVVARSMDHRAGLLGRARSAQPPDVPPWCNGNCGLRANTRSDVKKEFPGWCCGICCILTRNPELADTIGKQHGKRCVKWRGNRGHPTGEELYALVQRERERLRMGKDQMLQFALRLVSENADAPDADNIIAAAERKNIEGVVSESHTVPQEISQEWLDDPDWKKFGDSDWKDWTASSSTSSSSAAVPNPNWGAEKRPRPAEAESEDGPDNKVRKR